MYLKQNHTKIFIKLVAAQIKKNIKFNKHNANIPIEK